MARAGRNLLRLLLSIFWPSNLVQPLVCNRVKYSSCQVIDDFHLVCVGISPTTLSTDTRNITKVTLCGWPYKRFKVAKHIGHLHGIQHFTLTRSGVNHVESFRYHQALQTLNLSQLQLTTLEQDVFLDLPLLHTVDLRHNQLSFLDSEIFTSLPALRNIYLIGNNWTCDPSLIWITSNTHDSLGSKVCDKELLYCEGKSKAEPKPLVHVMKFIQEMQAQCPPACNCSVYHVVRAYAHLGNDGGKLLPLIKVNCNNRNLTSMPDQLPEYTTALYLRNNNLTTVEELAFNKHYRDVREVYLDSNQITAINILEGTHWLNNFGVLNLRGNQLNQIPLYALDHAFQSQKLDSVFLGNNPWKCDCKFTIHFQDSFKDLSKQAYQ